MIVLLSASSLHAQQSAPAPRDGDRVSMNQIWNSLPDFVCTEKIVSVLSENGKTKDQRVMESVFTVQRKKQTAADGVPSHSIVESRELTAIGGKPVQKNAKLPELPLAFDGLAANILFISEVPLHRAGPAGILDGRLSIRIGFSIRKSQGFLQLDFPAAVMGAQIDTKANSVLHVENRLASLQTFGGIPVSADFQSIEIDGKAYWLPRLIRAEAAIGKNQNAVYVAEYTECKKFEVTTEIRPVSVVPEH
jgi:hypothetical protein